MIIEQNNNIRIYGDLWPLQPWLHRHTQRFVTPHYHLSITTRFPLFPNILSVSEFACTWYMCIIHNLSCCVWFRSLTNHDVFKVHLYGSVHQHLGLLYSSVRFYCVSISHFVYSFVDGYFNCFHILSTVNSTRININTQIFESLLSEPLGM